MSHRRTDHTRIPDSSEINDIVAAEAKRPRLASKLNVRYADFSNIIRLYDFYGLDASIFYDGGQTTHQILDAGAKDLPQLTTLITEGSRNQRLLDEAYDYLSEEDELEPADFIFVFGSKTRHRAEKAIELYKHGLAKKIIFSGHVPSYGNRQAKPEAELYAELAIQGGVPERDIIIEKESITIPDNIRRTLNMLDSGRISYSSFILVNSPYAQRRGWCVFKKYTEDGVKIMRSNSRTKQAYDKGHWFTNPGGISMVIGEYFKLRNAVSFNDA